MKKDGKGSVEPSQKSVEEWTEKCNVSSNGKIWLQCNNWYMKGTKDDEIAGREKSKAMWMESYESYLEHLIGRKLAQTFNLNLNEWENLTTAEQDEKVATAEAAIKASQQPG